MPLLIAVLLGLSGLLVVIYPLLGLDRESTDALNRGPLGDVAERERSARDALREVEFDRRLGNLDDEDYQALRARFLAEFSAVRPSAPRKKGCRGKGVRRRFAISRLMFEARCCCSVSSGF